MAPTVSSLRTASILAALALVHADYNSTLLTFPWSYDCKLDSEVGIIDLVKDKGYHACGDLEFCQVSATQFAYRLPGRPCAPLKGPIIRLRAGKKYQLTLHNTAYDPKEECNLHTHGPHLSGDGNSDDITRHAFPGQALRYTWSVPANHPGATFWYHAHIHENTWKHVHGGALGMLLIDEDEETDPYFNLSPDFARWMRNEVLLIGAKVDTGFYGNGNCNEVLPAVQAEWFRFRLVAANPTPNESPQLRLMPSREGRQCMAYTTAHDGVFTWKIPEEPWAGTNRVVAKNTFPISGANRIDLAVNCPFAGDYDVVLFGGKVATLQVRAGTQTSATPWKPGNLQWDSANECNPVTKAKTNLCVKGLRPHYNEDLRSYTGPRNKMLIDPTSAGIKFNGGKPVLFDAAVPAAVVQYDDVQEWTIKNSIGHPFHLHVYHMQVVTPGGCGPAAHYGEFYDVIFADRDCTVRFRAHDHPGRVIFHCHLLKHEDAGTMSWIKVNTSFTGQELVPVDLFEVDAIDETNTYAVAYNTFGKSWAGYTNTQCMSDNKCYPSQQCSVSDAAVMWGVDRCGRPCELGDPLFSNCAFVGRKGATCGAGNLCRDAYPVRFAYPSRTQTNSFCPGVPLYAPNTVEVSAADASASTEGANSSTGLVWLAFLAVPTVALLALPAFLIWRRKSQHVHEHLGDIEITPATASNKHFPSSEVSPYAGHLSPNVAASSVQ